MSPIYCMRRNGKGDGYGTERTGSKHVAPYPLAGRVFWVLLSYSVAALGCDATIASLGLDRCFGEQTECLVPCGHQFVVQFQPTESVSTITLEPSWIQPVCIDSGCSDLDPVSFDYVTHEDGGVTTVGLWAQKEQTALLHVLRFEGDGSVQWSYSQTFPDGSPTWLAIAPTAKQGVVIALHGIQISGKPDASSTTVLEMDAAGQPTAMRALSGARRPLAISPWEEDLLVVSDYEASLYDEEGTLRWRQSALSPVAQDDPGVEPGFASYRRAAIVLDRGRALILRHVVEEQQSLVQLNRDGNVTWYGYVPPFMAKTPCFAAATELNEGPAAPVREAVPPPYMVTLDSSPLFVDAFVSLDGKGRVTAATTGYLVARFVEPLPTLEVGEFVASPRILLAQREQTSHPAVLFGLDVDTQDRVHALALIEIDGNTHRGVDRFSEDLSERETFLLPAKIEGQDAAYRGLKLQGEQAFFTLGLGLIAGTQPPMLLRFEFDTSTIARKFDRSSRSGCAISGGSPRR